MTDLKNAQAEYLERVSPTIYHDYQNGFRAYESSPIFLAMKRALEQIAQRRMQPLMEPNIVIAERILAQIEGK